MSFLSIYIYFCAILKKTWHKIISKYILKIFRLFYVNKYMLIDGISGMLNNNCPTIR